MGFFQVDFEKKKQDSWTFSRFLHFAIQKLWVQYKKLGFLMQNYVISFKFTKSIVLSYPILHINIYTRSFINVHTYGLFVSKCDEHSRIQINLGMSKS